MAQLDENAVGGAVQRLEAARAAGMARLAQRLADQGLLREDVTTERAADVLWLLAQLRRLRRPLPPGAGLSLDDNRQTSSRCLRERQSLPLLSGAAAEARRHGPAQRREAATRASLGAVGVAGAEKSTG